MWAYSTINLSFNAALLDEELFKVASTEELLGLSSFKASRIEDKTAETQERDEQFD